MKILIFFLIAVGLMLPHAFAQQSIERTPNGYSIQITDEDNYSHFMPMYGAQLKGSAAFTIAPRNIIKRAEKDDEQISLVAVNTEFIEGEWKVKVSVTFGEFYDKGSKEIAIYHIPEGEKVKIKEMSAYGIKPFEISIVKVLSAPPIQPEVINKTNSIAVLNVLATALPDPFKIELKNNSEKAVRALEIGTRQGKKTLFIQWPQGESWEHPLMGAGDTYKFAVSSAGRNQTVASEYVPDQTTIIEISTVVFVDGSYEGKPYLAAMQRAEVLGSKKQLEQVLQLMASARESVDGEPERAFNKLRLEMNGLSEAVQPAWLKEIERSFPTLRDDEKVNLTNFVKFGLHHVKTELIKDLNEFINTKERAPRASMREWLLKEESKYREWEAGISLKRN